MESNVEGRVDREEREIEGRGRRGERETIETLSEEEAEADDDDDDNDDEEEEEEEGAGGGTNEEERKLLDELEGLEEAEEEEYSGPLLAEDEEEEDDDEDEEEDGDEDEEDDERQEQSDRIRRIEEENMRRRGIEEENMRRRGFEEENVGRRVDEEEDANVRRMDGEDEDEEEEEEEEDYVDEDDEEEVNRRKGVEKGEFTTRRVQVEERPRHGVDEEAGQEDDDDDECQDSEGGEDDDEAGEEEEEEKERPSVLDFLKRPPELDAGTPEEQEEFSREVSRFLANRKMEYRPPRFYGTNLNMLQLWRTVIRLGAYDYVTANKLWRQVGETFNPPKKCTTVSWSFRGFYEKSLLDYERHMLRGTGYSTGRRGRFDADEVHAQNGLTQGRARRDAALRAMQGWHSQKIIENEDEAVHIPKEKVSTMSTSRRDKQMDIPKRKNPPMPDQPVKAARLMNGTRSQFVGNTLKVENDDQSYPSFNEMQKRQPLKQSHIKPVLKSSSYHLANGVDIRVADEGPEADWVKINVHKTGDCFEVYALVPGLLQEELRIQCEPGGMLVIIGEPEQPNNPWGVTPFRKVIKLPSAIDANQTSAVITLHGQLFVRVPYGET